MRAITLMLPTDLAGRAEALAAQRSMSLPDLVAELLASATSDTVDDAAV